MANASSDSTYLITSITKIFTAAVVIQLVDEGQLDLDAPIQQYLSHLELDGIHVYDGVDYSEPLKEYTSFRRSILMDTESEYIFVHMQLTRCELPLSDIHENLHCYWLRKSIN